MCQNEGTKTVFISKWVNTFKSPSANGLARGRRFLPASEYPHHMRSSMVGIIIGTQTLIINVSQFGRRRMNTKYGVCVHLGGRQGFRLWPDYGAGLEHGPVLVRLAENEIVIGWFNKISKFQMGEIGKIEIDSDRDNWIAGDLLSSTPRPSVGWGETRPPADHAFKSVFLAEHELLRMCRAIA